MPWELPKDTMSADPFGAYSRIDTPLGERRIARLDAIEGAERLPYSIKVLLESALRHVDPTKLAGMEIGPKCPSRRSAPTPRERRRR